MAKQPSLRLAQASGPPINPPFEPPQSLPPLLTYAGRTSIAKEVCCAAGRAIASNQMPRKSASENSFPSFSYSRAIDFTRCVILTAVPACAAKNVALSAALRM